MTHEVASLTSQQQAALTARGTSVALSAGAGCGKTFVLTQRFLSQLEPSCGPDPLAGLVAITFTERASREMRDRIRNACRDKLANCPKEQRSHWLSILHGLDSARISTIHSFCATLLRMNAVEARIDPRFEVLDAATANAVLLHVVADTVNDLLSGQDPDIVETVYQFGLNRTREFLQTFVTQRFRVDFARLEGMTAELMAVAWEQFWRTKVVPEGIGRLVEAPETRALLETLREHRAVTPYAIECQRSILEVLPTLATVEDPIPGLTAILERTRWGGKGVKVSELNNGWPSDDIVGQAKDRFATFRNFAKPILDGIKSFDQDKDEAIAAGLALTRLAHRAVQAYDARKAEIGALDFDDLLSATRNLLRDSDDVRRRAERGIRFLMVDEFQDTDPVQAEIVRMLCGDGLTSGKLFIVGDAKQSIYRFRRADPTVFDLLRRELPEQGRLSLTTNFRSQPEILKFVNRLFAGTLGTDVEPLVPHSDVQRSPTPTIEFLFPRGPADIEMNTEALRRLEADWIARRICALLADPEPRVLESNPQTKQPELRCVQSGDIAILFRALTDIAIYEDALRDYGLDYYLVGGRAFFAQQEVYDLTNLCQYLANPDDEVSLVGVLRSPFFSLSDDTLLTLADEFGSLAVGLESQSAPPDLVGEQKRQVSFAADVLKELRDAKDRVRVAELLQLAMERTGYDASLLNEFMGERKLANLGKLIDMARQFDRDGLLAFPDFVERLRGALSENTDEALAATQAETSNVIRLMTIHQSKGLEFPVVIVADMNRNNRDNPSGTAFLHPEMGALVSLPHVHGQPRDNVGKKNFDLSESPAQKAENVRLLYVATTRAADHLILSAAFPGSGQRQSQTSEWIKLLDENFVRETGDSLGEETDDAPQILVHDKAPDASKAAASNGDEHFPLADFRDAVELADPIPLPGTLAPISAENSPRRRLTVSAIEVTDAILRQAPEAGKADKKVRSAPAPADGPRLSSADAERLGSVVHAILQQIDFSRPSEFQVMLQNQFKTSADQAVADRAGKQLECFANSALPLELASAKTCYRELDFLLRWPGQNSREATTITGQIDVLMESAAGVWSVLDYKTMPVPAGMSEASLLAEYEIQLGLYALAVQQLVGRVPDRVELVLLDGELRRVPLAVTDEFLGDITTRVNAVVGRFASRKTTIERPAQATTEPGSQQPTPIQRQLFDV